MKIYPKNTAEIMYLVGDINYTDIHLLNGKKIVSGYTILKHEQKLEGFVRIHRKYLVNPVYIGAVKKIGPYWFMILNNGQCMKISKKKVKSVVAEYHPASANKA